MIRHCNECSKLNSLLADGVCISCWRERCTTITQERDALREAVRNLIDAGGLLASREEANHGSGSRALAWWDQQEIEAAALMTPSGEAGKGGGA